MVAVGIGAVSVLLVFALARAQPVVLPLPEARTASSIDTGVLEVDAGHVPAGATQALPNGCPAGKRCIELRRDDLGDRPWSYVVPTSTVPKPRQPPPVPRGAARPARPRASTRGGLLAEVSNSTLLERAPPPSAAARMGVFDHSAVVALANTRGVACTGMLVAPSVILTARHCLPLVEARFGPDARAPLATAKVIAARVPRLVNVDLALLKLDVPSSVTPLPLRSASDSTPPFGVHRLVGFGAIDNLARDAPDARHYADVRLRDWGCDRSTETGAGCLPDFELMIPRGAGADTCTGDSGGPVLETTKDGFRIVAVTSRSVRDALLTCGDGGVYTRVDRFADWLRTNIDSLEKLP